MKELSAIVAHFQVKIVVLSGKSRFVDETYPNTSRVQEVDLVIAKCVRVVIALFLLLKVHHRDQFGSVCLVLVGIDVFSVGQVALVRG